MSQSTVFDLVAGESLARQDRARSITLNAALVLTSSLVMFASSRMSVEIGPVPVTMQSIAAIMLALVLGPQRAIAATALYFIECWAIPGFSTRPMMLTGGYVLGFVAAAAVAGKLYHMGHGRSWLKALGASAAANLVIFAIGLPWLAMSIGMSAAWEVGAKPFFLAEIVKIAIGIAMLRSFSVMADRLSARQS